MNKLILPDLHFPFEHKDALEHCQRVQDENDAQEVISIGDIIDHHAISRFTSELDAMTAEQEFEASMEALKPWKKAFPKMKLVSGNHCLIPQRRAKELGFAKAHMPPTIAEAYEFPKGWEIMRDLFEDDVHYLHSAGSGAYAAFRKAKEDGMSTVAGHTHKNGGVINRRVHGRNYFGMNTACLIDESSYAMRYASMYEEQPLSLGCGVVYSSEEAYFCPLRTK